MAKPPPSTDEFLGILKLVTPAEYHDPFFDDLEGAIATYRGWARAHSEMSKVAARGVSRQFFTAPPGLESAGNATRATITLTLRRTADLDEPLFVATGELTVEGPRERVYRSTEDIVWFPFDPVGEQMVTLECDYIGEPGNLDFLGDADGNLVDPVKGGPALDVVDLQDLSQGRAGIRGVLVAPGPNPGGFAELTDDGGAPTFAPSDVGLYVKINAAADPTNVGRVTRILEVDIATTVDPISGLFARTVILDDGPQPFLVEAAIQDDGGVFTQFTAAAQSPAPDDVDLMPDPAAVNDAFYFGALRPFSSLAIEVTTQRFGTLTLAWEYWNGAAWVPFVDLVDDTQAFSLLGTRTASWTVPGSWATTTVDGVLAFFARARIDTFVSLTQQPLAGRVVTLIPDPLATDPLDAQGLGQITWAILDWKDLGLVITEMTAPAGGRDDDLGLKLSERQVRRRPGESIDVLRKRASMFPATVTPEMIEWEINRLLEPFGLAGQVCDLAKGYSGLFWDVPITFAPDIVAAWDMFAPGDLFPDDQTLLPLSLQDSKWHFWVKVPVPSLGEIGAAWDDGPPSIFIEAFGTFIGSAWDYAFTDGFAVVSALLYKEVFQRVNEAKAGGIRFTMLQAEVPVCP